MERRFHPKRDRTTIIATKRNYFRKSPWQIMVSYLECHGFGVFDKAVRTNATYSILHDDVEESIIVAPRFCDLEEWNFPGSIASLPSFEPTEIEDFRFWKKLFDA